jgi:hypothetical protein
MKSKQTKVALLGLACGLAFSFSGIANAQIVSGPQQSPQIERCLGSSCGQNRATRASEFKNGRDKNSNTNRCGVICSTNKLMARLLGNAKA